MRLSRLLALGLISLLLLWSLVMARSQLLTLRDSIQDQMQANLETSVTSLGLVLQGAFLGGDPVMAETLVNALFDGGYVKSIRLVDPDGKVVFAREFTAPIKEVPSWLPDYVPFAEQTVQQEITDGWNILGMLTITGHSSYGYAYLWQAIQRQAGILSFGILVALLLLFALLLFVLLPLRAVIQRISAMAGNHLPSPVPPAFWHEIRQLDEAVNRLIQEKRRNHERRKLKLLRWRLAADSELSVRSSLPRGVFTSTQGQLVLYRQVNDASLFCQQGDIEQLWAAFNRYWLGTTAAMGQGRRIPLELLVSPYRDALLELLRKGRPGMLEWVGRPVIDQPSPAALFKVLKRLGYEHVLADFGCSRQDYQWLEWMRPRWVICQWSAALPAQYWILQNVTLHDLGVGVLVYGCLDTALMLELEFNGYLVAEPE
ncbi:LapD/MoxY N-terminal periplasmic domain-containing protein [Pseudaeromonas sharmana]|uniref:LapD/MoxY N-terminal periplasmic domain-containing protein n=1 Tax=Pseudaeromonas sharmana TaxID=328412 RepID=A0ABV8CRE2_9GAMM